MAWIRTKVKVPIELNKSEREKLSDEIINFIIERSQAGFDKDGKKFHPYTKDYASAKGVSRSNVDLTLSSEMLESIKLLQNKKGVLTIGFDKGSPVNGKAEGNIKGTYGQPKPVTKPRDFLGIDEGIVEILADTINDEIITPNELEGLDIDARAREIAKDILGEDIFD